MNTTNISKNPASEASAIDYDAVPIKRAEHSEDPLTRIIEQQAAKIPSHFFLIASLAAMATSLAFEVRGEKRKSAFIGMWPTPLLLLGIYNKIVKTFGAQ